MANGKWQLTTSKLPKDTNHKIFIFQTDLEANTTSYPFEYIPGCISVIEIKNNGQLLTKDKDYKISNTQIIFTSQYINNLDNSIYNLDISFYLPGKTDIISINIGNLKISYTYGDTPDPISLNCGKETGKVTYRSSDENVATIDSKTGELKIKNAGKFKITATI